LEPDSHCLGTDTSPAATKHIARRDDHGRLAGGATVGDTPTARHRSCFAFRSLVDMSFISPRNIVFAPLLAAAFMAGIALAGSGAQPLAGECTLDPLTLPLFDATPAAEIAATPLAGNPGSDTGDEAIREAVEGIVACINTGDAAYAYAIFTQRYLAEQLADSSATYQPEFEQQLSFGPSEVEETFELVDVTEITVLDNGLVSVVVELSAGGTSYRDTLVLANVDGVWLIDGIEAFDPPR